MGQDAIKKRMSQAVGGVQGDIHVGKVWETFVGNTRILGALEGALRPPGSPPAPVGAPPSPPGDGI